MKKMNLSYCFFALLYTGALLGCQDSADDMIPDIPPSSGTEMTLNGGPGGAAAQNSVYVDLSAESQDSVKRDSWDLAFYNGTEFSVRINNFAGAAVKATEYTELSQVSSSTFDVSSLGLGMGEGSLDMIDDFSGNLSGTAIATVAETAAENKVYVLSTRGGLAPQAEDVYKIRVTRSAAGGYTLEYALLNAAEAQQKQIDKHEEHNFQFLSLRSGNEVTAEPVKTDWDFVWSYSMYATSMGGPAIPYPFSDLVFINHLAGVSAAEVMTESVSYADFSETNLGTVEFKGERNVIGSSWRVTAAPGGSTAGVRQDRFYVIKDASGNIYKLKFNSFISGDGGTRGYPELEYALVKRG